MIKAVKYSSSEASPLDLGNKIIYKYPSPTKRFDIAKMVVNGRHPSNPKKFLIEHKCQFVIYVTKGRGLIYAGDQIFKVRVGDVVFVPSQNKFAVEGNLEYITVDIPAFFVEQSEEIII